MTQAKPKQWNFQPGLTRPEWAWVWKGEFMHSAWWEGGGTPRFYSNAGPIDSSLTGDPVWTAAEGGLCLDFDAAGVPVDGVTVADADLPSWYPGKVSGPYTLLILCIPDVVATTNNVAVKGDGTRPFFAWFQTQVRTHFDGTTRQGTTATTVGKLSLIGSSWDGSDVHHIIYDGRIDAIFTGIGGPVLTVTGPMRWGRRHNDTTAMNGRILATYDFGYQLTASQLAQLRSDYFGPWVMDRRLVKAAAVGGTNPHNPLGHPLYGPLAGPVAA